MLNKNDKDKQKQVQLVALEDLVPENHLLRKIDKYIDFDFIYDLVEGKYCLDNGRPSIDPVVLMKLAFIQYLFGIRSMRQTIKEVEVNLAYRWFLGLDFYDKVPHFSSFSKNYQRRYKDTDIFEQIFNEILFQAMSYGLVDTKIQFVDATHVKAHANRHKTIKKEVNKQIKKYQHQLNKEIDEDRQAHEKKALKSRSKECRTSQQVQSTSDPESGLFHKGEHKEVFAYTVQTSCDKNGWVLAYEPFAGNLHDSITFDKFFKEKLKNLHPEKLVLDAGYKTPCIAKQLLENSIVPVFPYTRPKGRSKKQEGMFYPKNYTYDEANDCYICPENKIILYSTTDRNGYRIYKSKASLCKNCPSLSKCNKNKKNQKTIIRHIWQDYIDITEEYRKTPTGKAEYKQRKETVERCFGSAKENHGFRYTNMKGLAKMRMKSALTFTCMNMKKLASILWKMDSKRVFFNAIKAVIKKNKDKLQIKLGFVFSLKTSRINLDVFFYILQSIAFSLAVSYEKNSYRK